MIIVIFLLVSQHFLPLATLKLLTVCISSVLSLEISGVSLHKLTNVHNAQSMLCITSGATGVLATSI